MDRGASRILLMVAKIVGDQAKPPARAAGDVHPISSSRSISPQSRGLVAAPAARRHNKKVVSRCGRPFDPIWRKQGKPYTGMPWSFLGGRNCP